MPAQEPQGYSIQQLAEKAGVSVRTIRFYISEGLLAVPPTRGRYTVYSDEYLDRLELIKRLKDSFLPLKEIRDRVTGLSWEEVKQALAQPAAQAVDRESSPSGESALRYISRFLTASPPAAPRVNAMRSPAPPPESWERLTLAPGVELHIRSDASPAHQRLARQIVEYAKKLFNTA